MTQEEKAKAYDEAIRKAKITLGCCDSASIITEHTIYDIFPELAENEDEKIRKALLNYLTKMWGNSQDDICGVHVEDAIAWLENQDEKDKKEINNFEVIPGLYKCVHRMFDGTPDGKLLFEVGNVYKCLSKHDRAEFEVSYGHSVYLEDPVVCKHFIPFEKQGEQKPATEMKTPEESLGIDSETYNEIVDECIYGKQEPTDKIKSKFKVGDWITNGACVIKITSVDDRYYWHDNDCVGGDIESLDKEYHLWTIADAKDGDILMANAPFIFNGNLEGGIGCPGAHCAINTLGKFQIPISPRHWTGHTTTPATKEQRDLLFQKMKDAGYEWNDNKKELKTIEQKPQSIVSAEVKEVDKSARSEEDTVTVKLQRIIDFLWHNRKGDTDAIFQQEQDIAWLKSLKQRLGGEK